MDDLTDIDRLLLVNQYRMLEALYPDKASEYSRARAAVEHGLSTQESKEVRDILQMFDSIAYAISQVGEDEVARLENRNVLTFLGFDGRNEEKQLSYCCHLLSDPAYAERIARNEHADYDRHMPILHVYRRMLHEWRCSSDPTQLSMDDLERIANSPVQHAAVQH